PAPNEGSNPDPSAEFGGAAHRPGAVASARNIAQRRESARGRDGAGGPDRPRFRDPHEGAPVAGISPERRRTVTIPAAIFAARAAIIGRAVAPSGPGGIAPD